MLWRDPRDVCPPPESRAEDRPLHEDVGWLATALGDVIRRFEGQAAFAIVEELRTSCRARRRAEPDAPTLEQLLARVETLPIETAAVVSRSFVLFFLLINTAEQVHRVRRRRAYAMRSGTPPQPASTRWAMQQLCDAGHSAQEVARAIHRLDVRPVLTAHPTEATRRTILAQQARIAEQLLARDRAGAKQRAELERSLCAEVELLWLTAEVRKDRLSVLDEVSTVRWYLVDRLFDASARVSEQLSSDYREVFDRDLGAAMPIRLGSWVGGDRDGNPFVTPETSLAAVRRNAYGTIGKYEAILDELTEQLSLSASIAEPPEALRESLERDQFDLPDVWQENRGRDADEPVRLKLSFIRGRLAATRSWLAARDAGRPRPFSAAYADADAFERDLRLVREALLAAGAVIAQDVEPNVLIGGNPARVIRPLA